MSETFKMMNWQLDQFTDQVLVALDQLISIVLSPFVWFFQHPLADFCKWLFGPQSIAQGETALAVILVALGAYAIFFVFHTAALVAIATFVIPALLSLKADTQIVHLCQSFVHSRQEIVHLGHKIVQSKTLLLTIFGRRSVLR